MSRLRPHLDPVRVAAGMLCGCTLLIFGAAIANQRPPETLADVLTHRVGDSSEGLDAAALSTHVTSGMVARRGDEIAFAYWTDDRSGLVSPPLHVGIQTDGRWHHAALTDIDDAETGSIARLDLTAQHLFIGAHRSPSAVRTIVVDRSLRRVGRFSGWWLAELPGRLAVFQRSMIHFAPAHPGELATFDLSSGREAPLYPTDKASPLRRAFMDRLRPILEEWRKREPDYVYSFDPAWFDVGFGKLHYDAHKDTLTIPTGFGFSRHPPEIAGPLRLSLTVVCRPMTSETRKCVESR